MQGLFCATFIMGYPYNPIFCVEQNYDIFKCLRKSFNIAQVAVQIERWS